MREDSQSGFSRPRNLATSDSLLIVQSEKGKCTSSIEIDADKNLLGAHDNRHCK